MANEKRLILRGDADLSAIQTSLDRVNGQITTTQGALSSVTGATDSWVEATKRGAPHIGGAVAGIIQQMDGASKAAGFLGQTLTGFLTGNILGGIVSGLGSIVSGLIGTEHHLDHSAEAAGSFERAMTGAMTRIHAVQSDGAAIREAIDKGELDERAVTLSNFKTLNKITDEQAEKWIGSHKAQMAALAETMGKRHELEAASRAQDLEDGILARQNETDAQNLADATARAATASDKLAASTTKDADAERDLALARAASRIRWAADLDEERNKYNDLTAAVGAAGQAIKDAAVAGTGMDFFGGAVAGGAKAGAAQKAADDAAKSVSDAQKAAHDALMARPVGQFIDEGTKSLVSFGMAASKAFGMLISGQKGAGAALGDFLKGMLASEAQWAATKAAESLGTAFLDLANPLTAPLAASAFQAAGIFGAIAAGTGILSAAIGSPGAGASAPSSGAANSNTAGAGMSGSQGSGQNITNIFVNGFIGAPHELVREVAKAQEQNQLGGGFRANTKVRRG